MAFTQFFYCIDVFNLSDTKEIKNRLLKKLPVLCISTQLIESGVDIDFSSVIRFVAGLDSIAQAAGRCNRNNHLPIGTVYVINPIHEEIDLLPDIKLGKDITLRVLSEYQKEDLLSPKVMERYFDYYFYQRSYDMTYPISRNSIVGRDDNLLSLLSENELNPGSNNNPNKIPLLKQSFMTAGDLFKTIDAPTYSVIVPFDDGKEIIKQLCVASKEFDAAKYFCLLEKAQKYSVNVFCNVWKNLNDQGVIYEIQNGDKIYYLDESYYSNDFGLSTEAVDKRPSMIY